MSSQTPSSPPDGSSNGQPNGPSAASSRPTVLPRVSAVGFFNASPLVEGLTDVTGLDVFLGPPSSIAPRLATGEADIGLASLADAARAPHPMTLLPVGMIGSDGATTTVKLFSRVAIESIERLHADTDSHTSVILARLLLRARFGRDPEVVPLRVSGASTNSQPEPRLEDSTWACKDGSGADRQAVLLIGDKVVTNPPSREAFPHELDLGQAWHEWTNLPMVYATWMCRLEIEDDPRIALAVDLLDRQRRHNAMRLAWIARTRGGEAGWPADRALEYVSNRLKYDVDERAIAGAQRFLGEAAAAGLLPAWRPRWKRVGLADQLARAHGAIGG